MKRAFAGKDNGMSDDSKATSPKISSTPKVNLGSTGFALGNLPLETVTSAHPWLPEALRPFDPNYTASLAAGLLTVPDLQSNCCRLEALVHLAIAAGSGRKKPSSSAVATWFDELGSGPCGVTEDPAEDGFTAVIASQRGNFRVLEGMWESASFFLQRIVNIVEQDRGGTDKRPSATLGYRGTPNSRYTSRHFRYKLGQKPRSIHRRYRQ